MNTIRMNWAGFTAAVYAAIQAGQTSPSGVFACIAGTERSHVLIDRSGGQWTRADLGYVRHAIDNLHSRGAVVRTWGKRSGNWTGAKVRLPEVAGGAL
jgi:hypothetical protein